MTVVKEKTMPKFEVTIQARVIKTYTVEADDSEGAYNLAHEQFTTLCDDTPEHYEQETLDIIELKGDQK
jgi:hypothetical protein